MPSELGLFLLSTACLLLQALAESSVGSCAFTVHNSPQNDPSIKRLAKMNGIRMSTRDGKYSYSVGICTDPVHDESSSDSAGVIQVDSGTNKRKSLGSFKNAKAIAGTNWIMLEYTNGDHYGTHCGKQGRRSIIIMTCDPGNSEGQLRFIEENVNLTQDNCYYLFEMDHQNACSENSSILPAGLSVGSIIVIIVFTLAIVYMLAGFLYQRFIVGAKGMEQFPHIAFWQDFGNLQADGCNFICRTGLRNQPKTYKGIGDDQLTEEFDDRDDNLLPM